MKEMAYVGEEAHTLANKMQDRLTSLPHFAGIIFVSVEPAKMFGGKLGPLYVTIGVRCTKDAGMAIIESIIASDRDFKNVLIDKRVIVGVSGAANDQSSSNVDSSEATSNDRIGPC